jgi:excisionase family DNA binding protein
MMRLLNTRELSDFLGINEKKIYQLIREKGLPATMVTGKWVFPQSLVEQWIENNIINYPENVEYLNKYQKLLIITGSNDILLDRCIALCRNCCPEFLILYANIGSMGGIRALKKGMCHICTSHLMPPRGENYNFFYIDKYLSDEVTLVNFAHRTQCLLFAKGNPRHIQGFEDLAKRGVRFVNRAPGCGTRRLLDMELKRRGISVSGISGYSDTVDTHLDVGIEIMLGRADVGVGIQAVAGLLELECIPIQKERFDLIIRKEHFFEKEVQCFLDVLHGQEFQKLGNRLKGYDLEDSGKVLFKS